MIDIDLKKWRKEHDVTLSELSKSCGIGVNTIMKAEKGVSISSKSEKKLMAFIRNYDEGGYYNETGKYKPAMMEIDDLWKYLPADIIYIAKDDSGDVYGFKGEPKYDYTKKEWKSDLGCCKIPLSVNFEDNEPDCTLVKRPYNYFDFIGKYGLFFDNDEETLIFGKLIAITGNGKFCREGSFFNYANFKPLSLEEKENLA